MKRHIAESNGVPSTSPEHLLDHHFNTVTGDTSISRGIATAEDYRQALAREEDIPAGPTGIVYPEVVHYSVPDNWVDVNPPALDAAELAGKFLDVYIGLYSSLGHTLLLEFDVTNVDTSKPCVIEGVFTPGSECVIAISEGTLVVQNSVFVFPGDTNYYYIGNNHMFRLELITSTPVDGQIWLLSSPQWFGQQE